ncbi:MAG TPA: hypothetical protein VF712_00560 [Thermoleophilaceae bacterium]|jgi:hypothetical protein
MRSTTRSAERRAARRRVARRSAAGRRARARSRKAFRGLRRSSALRVARAAFPADVDRRPWRGPRLEAGERIKGYLDRNTALVDTGELDALATASFPLVTEAGQPVDLGLVERGGALEPDTPLIPLRISRSPRHGAVVGSSGLGIAPARGAGEPAVATGGKVFYANVDTDTDLIVEPTLTGVETFTQLRSVDSPEDPALDLRLPSGTHLRRAGADALPGSLEVARGDRRVVLIDPPAAMDADGRPVPASYAIDGSRLVVRIPHRSRSFRYPILVDPDAHVWEDFRGWPDTKYWENIQYGSWASGYRDGSPFTNAALGGVWYGVGQWHQFRWPTTSGSNPPVASEAHYRDAFVFRADTSVTYTPNGTRVLQGFWPDQGWELARDWSLGGTTFTLCIANFCGGAFPDGRINGTDGNFFFHSLEATANGYLYGSYSKIDWTMFMVHDRHAPSVGSSSWTKDGNGHNTNDWIGPNRTVGVSTPASDRGLGLRQAELVSRSGGALVTPATRTTEPCYGGLLPHDTTPDYDGGPWHGQTRPGPDQGDRNRQCPLSQSYGWSFSSNSVPEGVNSVGVDAWDIVGRKAAVTNGSSLKVDRSGPTITDVSGSLYDRRNRSDDHRREGLYDAAYSLSISATDGTTASDAARRSGVKRLDVEVLNPATMQVERSDPDPVPQVCPAGSCGKTRPWVFRPDDYADGEHIVRVRALDQLDNPTTTEFRVTVDRRGDIYTASTYVGGNDVTGELASREWTRAGTTEARSVEPDQIVTRAPVSCPSNSRLGAVCDEVRARLLDSEDETFSPDDHFSLRVGERSDNRLEPVSDLADRRTDPAELSARGPLVSALEPWQHAPPAAGPDYELYQHVESVEDEAGTPRDVVVKLWVDSLMKFPLKLTHEVVGTTESAVTYYDYGVGRLTTSEVPSDLFRVPRPPTPGSEETEQLGWTGGALPAADRETGQLFQPRNLGSSRVVGSTSFCLAAVSRFTEDVAEPAYSPAPDEDPETAGDPSGPITAINSDYNVSAPGATCEPGTGSLDEPSLTISSYAASSTVGAAWVTAYREAVVEYLSDPQDDGALQAGTMPVTVGVLEPAIAYVVPYSDTELAVLAATATSVYTVKGTFSRDQIPLIFASMEAAQ